MTAVLGIEVPKHQYVIIAADTQATFGKIGLKEEAHKLQSYRLPNLNASIAITGDPRIGQIYTNLEHRINKLTDSEYRIRKAKEHIILNGTTPEKVEYIKQSENLPKFDIKPKDFMHQFKEAIYQEQMNYKNLKISPGQGNQELLLDVEFIVGIVDKNGETQLQDVHEAGVYSQKKKYIVRGTGLLGGATHVLETRWKEDLSIEESIELAVDAIQGATEQISNVGKGININVITPKEIIELEQYLKPEKFDKSKLIEQYKGKVA